MLPTPFYVEPKGIRAAFARALILTKKYIHPRLHTWLIRASRFIWAENDVGIGVIYGDVSIFLDLEEGAEQEIFLGRYDPALTNFVANVCKKNDVVVDIGANVGIVSIIASNSVTSGGRVLAAEPNPDLAARLQFIRERNAISQLEVVPVAVGSAPGSANLHLSSSHPYSTLDENCLPNFPVLGSVEVVVETLDELIKRHLSDLRPTLVKLDVQGYENKILLASEVFLREISPKYILSEFFSEGWLETVEVLARCGYGLARIDSDGSLTFHDSTRFRPGENAVFYLPHGDSE